MAELSTKAFDALARDVFGAVLVPHGFSASDSRRCPFYRKVSDEVYHFGVPDRSRKHPQYAVNVFPRSPKLNEDFRSKFPDDLGFTADVEGFLSRNGVGLRQEWFWRRTAEGFQSNFEEVVRQALLNYAIPFLNPLQNLESFARVIHRGPYAERLQALGHGA